MFKLYSKGCQYALRALVLFVSEPETKRFQAADICERLDIPEPFTRKIFQSLVQAGLLAAHRGPGGGYSLVRDPRDITLLEAIQAVEGPDTFSQCVLGFSSCNAHNPCPLHDVWLKSKRNLLDNMGSTTLHDLSAAVSLRGHATPTEEPRQKRRKSAAD